MAAIACGLAVVVLACAPGYVPAQTAYWVRNDSDSTAIVRFDRTPDHPEMYAFSVPAGATGLLGLEQGWAWDGTIAVLDKTCRVEWTQLIQVAAGKHDAFADDIEGGSLVIAKDRHVTWAPGKVDPIRSSPSPGTWQWVFESTTCGRPVIPNGERH